MKLRHIASVSISLKKALAACLTATLLAAPSVAQTSRDALMRGAYETDAGNRRVSASIAEAQRIAKGLPKKAGAEATPASSQPGSVDPAAWGVFARLVGNRWQTADGVVRVFEWSSDARELVESELVGGLPRQKNIYSMQDNELVQHECLAGLPECIRFESRFGTVADDGSVLFKEIVAVGKAKVPSVVLRERPIEDWNKWQRKYLLVGEKLYKYQLVGTDQLEVTQSFSGKYTDETAEAPWGAPQALPTIAYSRIGDGPAQSEFVATADFGPMEIFAGQRMISEDLNEILELQHLPDGSMAIQWFSLSGQPIGRYVMAVDGAEGKLELRDYPYTNSQSLEMRIKVAVWTEGGVLSFHTQIEGGHSLGHSFSVSNGKLRTVRYDFDTGRTLLGKPKVKDFSSVERIFIPATQELIAQAVAAHERRLEAQRRQAERELEERRQREAQAERDFARFMGGLNTFVNTYRESMAEARANEARQQAFLDDLREKTEEIDRRRRAAQGQADAQTQHAPSAASNRPAPVQQSSVAPSSTKARTEPSPERRVPLIETPEAIVVCTHPNDKGRFKCATPAYANFEGGPNPGDLWRTPQDFVAQTDTCSSARRLQSATHLVWGCGYGATNGGSSMDRSAGVDVKGRNTYYCTAREWPCRRTSPE